MTQDRYANDHDEIDLAQGIECADAGPGTRGLFLMLDDADWEAVQQAMARRQAFCGGAAMPDGTSNLAGAVLAEICRGWEEMLNRYSASI